MNLDENISRVQSLMGLNESLETAFKRRMYELPKFIRATKNWLNAKAFDSFGEFIERVIFATTRDFSAEFSIEDYDQLEEFRNKIGGVIRNYILDNYMDEIKEYYMKERGYGD